LQLNDGDAVGVAEGLTDGPSDGEALGATDVGVKDGGSVGDAVGEGVDGQYWGQCPGHRSPTSWVQPAVVILAQISGLSTKPLHANVALGTGTASQYCDCPCSRHDPGHTTPSAISRHDCGFAIDAHSAGSPMPLHPIVGLVVGPVVGDATGETVGAADGE
jgi:hypothetical protein